MILVRGQHLYVKYSKKFGLMRKFICFANRYVLFNIVSASVYVSVSNHVISRRKMIVNVLILFFITYMVGVSSNLRSRGWTLLVNNCD